MVDVLMLSILNGSPRRNKSEKKCIQFCSCSFFTKKITNCGLRSNLYTFDSSKNVVNIVILLSQSDTFLAINWFEFENFM